ncbi:H-NS family nucleoid-associated regulatory protein [Roseicella sp. DB1501]|uniref:H-NS histone family protein n=1 Tax=Roseicella sp. DB1501 TaxID=2730925 RepID=UPI0014923407|nr:H-NS histone family protein [Roseicella sp. DB1501]NOG70486.1 H-NS histone family protein [Roseicella sp. DB1501]
MARAAKKASEASEEPVRDINEDVQPEETPAFLKPLDGLNVGQLRQAISYAEARIRQREASEKASARDELMKLAQEKGFAIHDLFGDMAPRQAGPAKRGRKPKSEGASSERASPPAKYRNPATGEEWSGRGRAAKWIQVAEAEGKSRDEFLIEKPAAE